MTSARLARLVLRTGLGMGISAASILLISKSLDLGRTRDALETAGWPALATAAGLLLTDVLVRGMRWRALLRPIRELHRPVVVAHLLVGYLANNALPARLGELVRSHTLGDREGISRATVAGTVVVERLIDIAVLALVSLLALTLTPSSGGLQIVVGTAFLLSVVGMWTIWLIAAGAGPARLSALLDRRSLRVFVDIARRVRGGLGVVRSRTAVAHAVAWSLLAWGVTGIAFASTAGFIGLQLSVPQIVLFVAGANLATIIPAGPAYLGTFELAAVSVAAAIGAPAADALAMAVIVHLATVVTTSAGGLLSLAYLYLSPTARAPQTLAPEMVERER